MKRLAVALLATVLVLLAPSPAFAAKPTHTRIPFDQYFVDRSCGFSVGVRFVGITVDIQWTNANGDVRDFQAYPQAKQVLTNLATGKTITTNLAGPQHLTARADGSLTIIGTGLTRTGAVQSVHAFGEDNALALRFVLFLCVILVGSVGLLLVRLPRMRSAGSFETSSSTRTPM